MTFFEVQTRSLKVTPFECSGSGDFQHCKSHSYSIWGRGTPTNASRPPLKGNQNRCQLNRSKNKIFHILIVHSMFQYHFSSSSFQVWVANAFLYQPSPNLFSVLLHVTKSFELVLCCFNFKMFNFFIVKNVCMKRTSTVDSSVFITLLRQWTAQYSPRFSM
jgi:hypothetical protein